MFEANEKPYLISPWILRNDNEYMIVYKNTVEKDIYRALTPLESLIIPLFDGKTTISDIQKYALEFAGLLINKMNNAHIIYKTIDNIVKSESISTFGSKSPSLKINNGIINPSHYLYPEQRLNRPLSVKIAFSNKCSFDCKYCYAEKAKCPEVPLQKWLKIFDELKNNDITLVDIAGADIFSRSDSLMILKEMTDRDFVFFLSTKSFINNHTAEKLASYKIGTTNIDEQLIRYFQLSIDSLNNGLNKYLIGSENHFKKIKESVRNLQKVNIQPRIKCVVTPLNIQELTSIVSIFSELGVKSFQFVQYSRSIYRHDNSLFLQKKHKECLDNISMTIKDSYPNLNINIQNNQTLDNKRNITWEEWENRAICSGGRSNMIIQPNGDVTLCDQIPHSKEYIIGNVFQDGAIKVWNSNKMREFLYPHRRNFKGTVCYDCEVFEKCHNIKGYCYRDVLSSYNTIYDAQPECPLQDKQPVREI